MFSERVVNLITQGVTKVPYLMSRSNCKLMMYAGHYHEQRLGNQARPMMNPGGLNNKNIHSYQNYNKQGMEQSNMQNPNDMLLQQRDHHSHGEANNLLGLANCTPKHRKGSQNDNLFKARSSNPI